MSVPVLSGRPQPKKTEQERAKRQQRMETAESIPPELLIQRDSSIRYEKDGPVYATDGKIGNLKKVVVDESIGEVVELIVQVDGSDRWTILPPDVVDRSAGSALFLTINHVQFNEHVAAGPDYVKNHFARADIKSLLKKDKHGVVAHPKRKVAACGPDFVETPKGSPLDRLSRKHDSIAAD